MHLRRQGELCELKALVFSAADFANTETHANVAIKVLDHENSLTDGQCSLCSGVGEQVGNSHLLKIIIICFNYSCVPACCCLCILAAQQEHR